VIIYNQLGGELGGVHEEDDGRTDALHGLNPDIHDGSGSILEAIYNYIHGAPHGHNDHEQNNYRRSKLSLSLIGRMTVIQPIEDPYEDMSHVIAILNYLRNACTDFSHYIMTCHIKKDITDRQRETKERQRPWEL